jgi:hypothetical protein
MDKTDLDTFDALSIVYRDEKMDKLWINSEYILDQNRIIIG